MFLSLIVGIIAVLGIFRYNDRLADREIMQRRAAHFVRDMCKNPESVLEAGIDEHCLSKSRVANQSVVLYAFKDVLEEGLCKLLPCNWLEHSKYDSVIEWIVSTTSYNIFSYMLFGAIVVFALSFFGLIRFERKQYTFKNKEYLPMIVDCQQHPNGERKIYYPMEQQKKK